MGDDSEDEDRGSKVDGADDLGKLYLKVRVDFLLNLASYPLVDEALISWRAKMNSTNYRGYDFPGSDVGYRVPAYKNVRTPPDEVGNAETLDSGSTDNNPWHTSPGTCLRFSEWSSIGQPTAKGDVDNTRLLNYRVYSMHTAIESFLQINS